MADNHIEDRFSTLTPERIAKGDLDYSLYSSGAIRSAQAVRQTILSTLVERSRLEDYAITAASTFMDWREAHSSEVDGRPYTHEPNGTPSEYTKSDRYKLLIRIIPKMQTDLVLMACDPEAKPHALSEALRDPSPYQTAFEWLSRAIGEILKDYEATFRRVVKDRPLMQC